MASIYSLLSKPNRAPQIPAVQPRSLQQYVDRVYLLQIFLVFAAYLIAGKLGQATTNIRSSNLGPVWPAYGVAIAAILICGYRVWLAVAAAAFLVAFFSPVSHVAALGQAAASTIAALAGAFLLYRIANFDRSLRRLSDALSLIVIGGFGSAIISASLGILVLHATQVHAYSGLGAAWLIYWLGDATGVLLVTPLALRLGDLSKVHDRHRITELVVLLLLLTVTCFLIFNDLPWILVNLDAMAFAVLPFIVWAAIRFGLGIAALSIFIVAVLATVETALGSGPFASNSTFVNAVLLDVFFTVLSVTGLSLAAVIGEREHLERERQQVVSQQAAMEERLRVADALREREQKLREYEKVIEGAEEMIAVVDRDCRYLIANNQFVKMRNMTREQVVGHFAHEVLSKDFFETVVKPKLDDCFQGKVVRYETKFSYPGIGERDMFISYFPIEGDHGIDRAACIIQDITDRKRSEESLRESEERFRLAVETGKMYSFDWDVTTDIVVRSPERLKILGATEPLRFSHSQFVDKIHPDDRMKFISAVAELTPENPIAEVIYRLPGSDGAFVWLKSSGRALFDQEGRMLRVIGMVADITDFKRAEEALAGMTGKLIQSQEQERARIGRELHDDVNQRLAIVSIELEELRQNPSEVGRRVRELQKNIGEIAQDVHGLSHDLHSSKLEYLGVVAGTKSWCKDFAERQRVEIAFESEVKSAVPLDVGVSLFRVLQEALHNATRHSGAKRVEVVLREDSHHIHLTVADLGRGFDVEAALHAKGLGLTSMRERIRLVNGTISIESKPQGGTTIRVRVPLESKHNCRQMAG